MRHFDSVRRRSELCRKILNFELWTWTGYSCTTDRSHSPPFRRFRHSYSKFEGGKFMPASIVAGGVPRIVVVMAQLIIKGQHCGIRPFVVPLNDGKGMHSGVSCRYGCPSTRFICWLNLNHGLGVLALLDRSLGFRFYGNESDAISAGSRSNAGFSTQIKSSSKFVGLDSDSDSNFKSSTSPIIYRLSGISRLLLWIAGDDYPGDTAAVS
ncbi:hypothetical protein B0H16DRAFT_1402879 [Mycena metata]|uniref:Uncharacterized protein n=1 Tax=Mycena metata TaxID=1033252 RepID=A0AAD7KC43_9AGAR|nr:hypothetical protein B0H16DRAFT_1402879 [Mycena metata]